MEHLKTKILLGTATREDLERVSFALETSGDGIFDWDLVTGDLYLSSRWCAEVGLDPNNSKNNYELWKNAIHPEDRPRIMRSLQDHLEGKTAEYQGESRVLGVQGTWIWVHSSGKVVKRDASGRALRMVGTRKNISKERDAEHALRLKDAQLQQIMEIAPVGIYQADRDGKCTYVNKAWSAITGLSLLEAVDRPWLDFVPEEDRAKILEQWEESQRTGQQFNVQYRHRNLLGQDRWMLGNAVVIRDSAGALTGYVGTVQDISALRDAHQKLQNFLENIPAGAVYIENEKMVFNRACEEIIGYSRDEIGSVSQWFEYLQPADPKSHRLIYEAEKAKGFLSKPVIPLVRKDGTIRYVEFSGVQQLNFEVWHLSDVTERLLAEEKFRVIFEKSNSAHLLMEEHGIFDCNQASVAQLGFSGKSQVLGKNISHFSPELQPDGLFSADKEELVIKLAKQNGFHRFEWNFLSKGGIEFPVEMTLSVVMLNSHSALLVAWHDLTNQKNIQAQIAQSSKMASLGEMAGGLAHEINNPLTIIKTKAEQISLKILRNEPIDPQWILEKVGIVDQTVERIAKIVKGLKNFARDSSSEPFERADLASMIDDTLSFCSARFSSHDVNFSLRIPKRPIILDCHPVQLTQVFLNLLNNAFDAAVGASDKWVRIEVTVGDSMAKIYFIDSGRGVEKKNRAKIMQPFFTTKEVGKGTGLGLSISRGLLETHQGSVRLLEDREHTTFLVSLPLSKGPSEGPGKLDQ